MKKRILSFLLGVMMLVTMLPMTAYAAEEEMSDEFKAILNDKGQYVINTVVPTTDFEVSMYLFEYVLLMSDETVWIEDVTYDPEDSTCVVELSTEEIFERHIVEIVFNYDEDVKADLDALVESLPDEEVFFEVRDLELINYWMTRTGTDADESGAGLDNFSGELKALLGNKNYSFYVDNRMGWDNIFATERAGIAWLTHDGVAYHVDEMLGTRADHILYVPDETGDSAEELLAAVQKRIDDYIGKGKLTVKLGGDDLSKAMDYIDPIIKELDEEKAIWDAREAELYADYNTKQATVNEISNEIAGAQYMIESLTESIEMDRMNIEIDPDNAAMYEENITRYTAQIAENEALIAEKTPLLEPADAEAQAANTAYYDFMNDEYWPFMDYYNQYANMKDEYLDLYNDPESEISFIHDAAGGYWFEVECGGETYRFVVMKDSDKMITPTYASADIKTDVTVSSTDSSIPLDTRVDVDKLTSGTEYDKIMNVLEVKDNITFDISLYSDAKGDNVTKLDNGTFEVKIPVSDELKGKDLIAYYVDKDNKVVEYEVTVKDGYALFDTDHFSIYTIAEAPKSNVGGEDEEKPAPEVVVPENNAAGSVIEEDAETVVEKVPFTDAEKAEIEAGAEVVITLEVKDITETVSAEDKTKVEAEAKEQTIGMYLGVNMFKQVGDNEAVKIPELNGKVKIQLTVPDELLLKDTAKNRIYSIIRIHDGVATVLDAKFDAETKKLEFETDCFSTYALVYEDVIKVPATGDNTTVAPWIFLFLVGAVVTAYGVKRRHS